MLFPIELITYFFDQSGCITSAESVLITQQSKTEFFTILKNQPDRILIVTISPQVRASIATFYNISSKIV